MASYRSHTGVPRRPEQLLAGTVNPNSKRAPSTRIPPSKSGPSSSSSSKQPSSIPTPSSLTSSKLSKRKLKKSDDNNGKTERTIPSSNPGPSSKPAINAAPSKMIPPTKSSTYPPAMSPRYRQPDSNSWREIPLAHAAPRTRFEPTRTPSLVSGSSASTQDSPNSNHIRRKASSIGRPGNRNRSGSTSSHDESRLGKPIGGFIDPFQDSVLGITMPTSTSVLSHMSPAMPSPHDAGSSPFYSGATDPTPLRTDNLPPPTLHFTLGNGSPSTRYSESPGVFSISSTPTSISSYSPGVLAAAPGLSVIPNTRPDRKKSPKSRPPITRRKGTADDDDGLSSVRESTSSSSTIRAPEPTRMQDQKATRRLSTPPPSPPLQKPSIPPVVTRAKTAPEYIQTVNSTISPRRSPQPPFNKTAPLNPPEFAHLGNPPAVSEHPNASSPLKAGSKPIRPSRDGTPDMSSLREASPVIQSNLTHLPSQTHRRKSSSDSRSQSTGPPPAALNNTPRTRFGFASRTSSRNPSPSPSNSSKVSVLSPSYISTSGLKTPDLSESEQPPPTKLRRPSAGSSTGASPKPRFGFFRRKTEPAVTTASTHPATPMENLTGKDKKLRKGPAAGTGHEGYGRYGHSASTRGRSGSTTSGTNSAASGGRSGSAGSRSSRKSSVDNEQEIDDFLSSRIAPVTLRGQGVAEVVDRKGSASSQESMTEQRKPIRGKLTLLPSPMEHGHQQMTEPVKRRTYLANGLSTLASRRISRRSQLTPDSNTPAPTPLNVAASIRSPEPALGSATSRADSNDSTASRNWFRRKGSDAQSQASQSSHLQPQKPAKKWNFFQRTMGASAAAAASPRRDGSTSTPSMASSGETGVAPTKYAINRTVAHYAMSDPSAPDRIDMAELENILREADIGCDEDAKEKEIGAEIWAHSLVSPIQDDNERLQKPNDKAAYKQSMLLPPPPSLPSDLQNGMLQRPASPKVFLRKEQSPVNPSNLARAADVSPLVGPIAYIDKSRTSISPMQGPDNEGGEHWQTGDARQLQIHPQPPHRSRLPQVGRIPQVVSKRDREIAPSTHSFSRPFVPNVPRPGMSPPLQQMATVDGPLGAGMFGQQYQGSLAFTDVRYGNTLPPTHPQAFNSEPGIASAQQEVNMSEMSRHGIPFGDGQEFLRLAIRQNSEASTTSNSTTGAIPIPIALIPPRGAPVTEDEVWNEYNDFIDDVVTPRTPRTPGTGSSLGAPFHHHYLATNNPTNGLVMGGAGMSQHPGSAIRHQQLGPTSIQNAQAASNGLMITVPHHQHLQPPPLPQLRPPHIQLPSVDQLEDIPRLSVTTPNSPLSITDFLNAYGDRNTQSSFGSPSHGRFSSGTKQSLEVEDRPSVSEVGSIRVGSLVRGLRDLKTAEQSPLLSRDSQGSELSHFSSPSQPRHTDPKSQLPSTKDRDSRPIAIAQQDQEETGSMGNLRFGALMTSKWLSFGRVLFSPAHYEVQERSENRVLILDGLGKDWSYYAALTYPNATIYSLGPDPTIASPTSSNPAGQSPTNHRHIHHPYPNAPFPFPRGFFACAVFRFPQAVPDSAYSATLSECKRVLRPGGYLEVFALDLDLLNMGNRARRAVRSLKERMQFAQPGVSLKPVADNLMRCVGRRGFEGLQRCVVGVPISGPITRSMDESGSGEEGDAEGSSGGSKGKAKADEQSVESDASDGGDANITKMVARVGRWWYTQCYESGATSSDKETGQSIWDDRTLLRECERRGTNFRLLICYAQKPMVVKRRTVSV